MEDLSRKKSFVVKNEIQPVETRIPSSRSGLENRVNFKVLSEIRERVGILDSKINEIENILSKNLSKNNLSFFNSKEQDGQLYDNFISEIQKLNSRISELERKFDERIPKKALSEDSFKEEAQDGEEFYKKIISEIRKLMQENQNIKPIENLTIVESKRIEKIKSFLKRHEQLSSSDLSQLMGLSRTRCNEYFKKMENLGMVKSVLVKKEKFYKLKKVV